MIRSIVFTVSLALVAAGNGPMRPCREDDMYIADVEDLCRFWWCTATHGVIDMRCPPGARVPTWWTSSTDHEIPCNVDRREEVSCLRCDITPDARLPDDRDDCIDVNCGNGCTCQDLWQAFYCICPGDTVPEFVPVDFETNFCQPDPCARGQCFSQWDDYWCQCPNGWTGKNCNVSFCDESTCLNGGTCVIDDLNYHCECVAGFEGPCCDDGRAIITTPKTTTTTTTTTPKPINCTGCQIQVGDDCLVNKSRCDCYNCTNYNDICGDGVNGGERTCTSLPDLSGTSFSFVFMQNRPDDDKQRALEIYVTAAGNEDREVRVYTPYLERGNDCYFEETKMIPGFTVSMTAVLKPECNEQKGSRKFSDKMLKAETTDGKSDILVYAVNRDTWSADAWIAYPDKMAKTDFMVLAYGPARFATQFSVLALENDTEVSFEFPPGANPARTDTSILLNAGESYQVQDRLEGRDLSGTRINSTKPIHAYSGNIRALVINPVGSLPVVNSRSRDHLVEQLIPIANWGKEYIVVPIPDRIFGDQIKVLAAEDNTRVTVFRADANGVENNQTFQLNAGQFDVFDALSNNAYRVVATNKVLVAQITKSKDRDEGSNDPSLIFIPAVQQYTNRYLFSTPEFSGGALGSPKAYNTSFVLLAAKTADRDGIEVMNLGLMGQAAPEGSFKVSAPRFGDWIRVPGSDYWIKAVPIDPGTNKIFHSDQDVAFMCLFYGLDDRESLGFPVSMLLNVL